MLVCELGLCACVPGLGHFADNRCVKRRRYHGVAVDSSIYLFTLHKHTILTSFDLRVLRSTATANPSQY